jgi:hypothetical protein
MADGWRARRESSAALMGFNLNLLVWLASIVMEPRRGLGQNGPVDHGMGRLIILHHKPGCGRIIAGYADA